MNALAPLTHTLVNSTPMSRKAAHSSSADILAHIYNHDINIAIWQRALAEKLTKAVNTLITSPALKPVELAVTPEAAYQQLRQVITVSNTQQAEISALCSDIALLVEMFCCLFDLKRAGLRLAVLNRPMCPRFHVDKIPCRLVTTYQGIGTQWLQHHHVDRAKLGAGNLGKPDEESGLFKHLSNIKQLNSGDIALLKGEYWDDNQGAGLVHRSAPMATNEQRLLLTLDFI
ncbi:DUF1826 domain-containing protein [Pseudoalteromonas sp.]|uniref:DUF1826 domain-containing protein n=1 Tax=Pseudoalteromonas sp. TaxID=53249 RepID=UPI0035666BE1